VGGVNNSCPRLLNKKQTADKLKGYLRGPGLPDGILSDKKSQYGYILECLGIENVGILHIWSFFNFSRPFGINYGPFGIIFCARLVYLSPFWYVLPRKIWQP
jgi:hypothetical protein